MLESRKIRRNQWSWIQWVQHALLAFCTGLLFGFGPGESHAEAAGSRGNHIQVPLTVYIATQEGRNVLSTRQAMASVRRANAALNPYGIEISVKKVSVLPEGFDQVKGPRARMKLARKAKPDGTIHVFFVDSVALFNPRHGDRRVSGMHWRYHGLRRSVRNREYLTVARDAPTTTLVHEIGHAFGLRHHQATDNLMCSCRRGGSPGFTRRQGLRLRSGARRFLSRSSRSGW